MSNFKKQINQINHLFLSNCAKILKFEWKTIITELIQMMSIEFACTNVGMFKNFFQNFRILSGESIFGTHEKLFSFWIFLRSTFFPKTANSRNFKYFLKNQFDFKDYPELFWIYNLPSAMAYSSDEIHEILSRVKITPSLIPVLLFDPLYERLYQSDSLQFFFQEPGKGSVPEKYRKDFSPDFSKFFRFLRDVSSPDFSPIKFDLDYHIKNFKEFLIGSGIQEKFSSKEFIHDFLEEFQNYFIRRLPSEQKYIKTTIAGFQRLLFLVQGELVKILPYREVRRDLLNEMAENQADWFLNRFFYEVQYQEFHADEFDVVIRLQNYLLIVEAKSTLSPVGIMQDILRWNEKVQQQLALLQLKSDILLKLITEQKIDLPEFLKGTKNVAFLIVKNEGITGINGLETLDGYQFHLQTYREWIDAGNIEEMWENTMASTYWVADNIDNEKS